MGAGNIVRFFFGSHATIDDALASQEHFAWCDVYVPELMGWTRTCRLQYRQVATNGVPAEMAKQLLGFTWPEFQETELGMLEDSGKLVEFIDVPGTSSLMSIARDADRALDLLPYVDGDWARVSDTAARVIDGYIRVHRTRDQLILDSLEELVGRMEGRKILVRMGLGHAGLATEAARRGLQVERAFQRQRKSFSNDGLMAYYGAQYKAIPSIVRSRLILSRILAQVSTRVIPAGTPEPKSTVVTHIANAFSEPEIAELWERVRGTDSPDTPQVILSAVRAKGFPVSDDASY